MSEAGDDADDADDILFKELEILSLYVFTAPMKPTSHIQFPMGRSSRPARSRRCCV